MSLGGSAREYGLELFLAWVHIGQYSKTMQIHHFCSTEKTLFANVAWWQ
jgi:hypothetical protein